MDGQYWKGDRTMSTNEWLLTSDFWQFLEPWHGRWYEFEIFIASCTDNIYDLENERWLLGDMIDHVGIYGSKVAEGLSAFNVGLVISMHWVKWSTVRLTKWPSTIAIRFVIPLHSLPVGWLQGQDAHITTMSWFRVIMTIFWHEVTIITTSCYFTTILL